METLLSETREKLDKLRSDPNTTKEQIRLVEEDLKTLEALYKNYYLSMNIFRTAKDGCDGLRE